MCKSRLSGARRWLIGLAQCGMLVASVAPVREAQSPASAAPGAKLQQEPARDYDLIHIAVSLNVDYTKLAFDGVATDKLAPLRDGLDKITLDCGKNLNEQSCEISGLNASCTHDGDKLNITPPRPIARGKTISVTVRYIGGEKNEGFQWIKPTGNEPQRIGFWTI